MMEKNKKVYKKYNKFIYYAGVCSYIYHHNSGRNNSQ